MGDFVRLELHGAVGVIRLDRPPVNAINIQIHHELLDVAQQVAESGTIRAVLLYGGERSFAAGADIKELATCGPGEITAFGRTLNHAISAIARLGQPVGAEAVRIGLATRSLPSEAVLPAAMELAGRLAAGPTAALAAAKRAIDDGVDGTVSAGLELEARRFAELFATDDQTIGMTSFLRDGPGKATFTGR